MRFARDCCRGDPEPPLDHLDVFPLLLSLYKFQIVALEVRVAVHVRGLVDLGRQRRRASEPVHAMS